MENIWLTSAVWIGLALLVSLMSIRLAISVALIEIMAGTAAGNKLGLSSTTWIDRLAGRSRVRPPHIPCGSGDRSSSGAK